MHVSEMDSIVEHDEPIATLAPPTITDVEKAIGEHCASLIKDGDCMRLGIGSIPDAVLLFLKEKKTSRHPHRDVFGRRGGIGGSRSHR